MPRPGGVDFRPIHTAKRERLLFARDGGIGIGGVEAACSDTIEPGLQIGDEE